MTISYGRLAMELTTSTAQHRAARSVISWLEDSEMIHIDELHWLAFLAQFNLPKDLQPGTLADDDTAQAIREAAAQDPGQEPALEAQDELDDLTSAAMTKMHTEATAAVTAWLKGTEGPLVVGSIVDSILGRCSGIVSDLARDAYRMYRNPES